MAWLRQLFRFVVTTVRFAVQCMHYLQRRRMNDARSPQLRLNFIHPPYWGAEALDFSISNQGGGAARNCRYCRLQEFTMAGADGRPASFSAQRWYTSERLDLAPQGQKRAIAALTVSPCARGILGDIVVENGQESSYQDALVCEDGAGTVYRFRCFEGAGAPPDVWSDGLLDGLRGTNPPSWVEWTRRDVPVERVRWSDVS